MHPFEKKSTHSRETCKREAILVGVLMLLQGSVTSVLLIWEENDKSKAKDFTRLVAKVCPRANLFPRVILVSSRFEYIAAIYVIDRSSIVMSPESECVSFLQFSKY